MKKSTNIALGLIAILFFHAPAFAEPAVSIWAGLNDAKADAGVLGGDFSDNGLRLGIGVDVAPWMGFEAGWADFGSVVVPVQFIPGAPGAEPVTVNAEFESSAAWLAYAPTWHRERLHLTGRIGAARVSTDVSFGTFGDDDETTTELLLGVAAAYDLTDRFGVRIDFERYGDVATGIGISAVFRLR